MTTIARTFVSIPERSARDTWEAIVDLIAPDSLVQARSELAAVAGIACSCISDEALADDAIVMFGVGPRLRIYAIYGDAAVEGEGGNESALSWVPTDGDWHLSIPCSEDDLSWVQRSLAKASQRVTARAIGAIVVGDEEKGGQRSAASNAGLEMDLNSFFRQ